MEISDRVAAVELHVGEIQDHGQPRFAIDDGVRWHWTDDEAERRDAARSARAPSWLRARRIACRL